MGLNLHCTPSIDREGAFVWLLNGAVSQRIYIYMYNLWTNYLATLTETPLVV